jgi:cytochrome d ubiquinol oxidase subunit I
LSFLAASDPSAEVRGLDQAPRDLWPNVELTHLAFQVMVGSGGVLVVLSAWFAWALFRGRSRLFERRWLLTALAWCAPLGFVGLEAGWFVTEVGRQPWIIQGVMKSSEAVTPADGVFEMFLAFTLLYALLGITVVALLRRIARPAPT